MVRDKSFAARRSRRIVRDATVATGWFGVIQTYRYRPRVLEELARHGLRPLPATSPERLREAVRDLYLYEIRRLRAELLRGHIVRKHYAEHVVALRRKYPLLSVPVELWTENP